MTQQLKDLIDLASRATEGPWGHFKRDCGVIDINQLYDGDRDGIDVATIYPSTDNAMANSIFIAAARNAIPALKEAVAKIERYEATLRFYADEENYKGGGYRFTDFMLISEDDGQRAREALEEK